MNSFISSSHHPILCINVPLVSLGLYYLCIVATIRQSINYNKMTDWKRVSGKIKYKFRFVLASVKHGSTSFRTFYRQNNWSINSQVIGWQTYKTVGAFSLFSSLSDEAAAAGWRPGWFVMYVVGAGGALEGPGGRGSGFRGPCRRPSGPSRAAA